MIPEKLRLAHEAELMLASCVIDSITNGDDPMILIHGIVKPEMITNCGIRSILTDLFTLSENGKVCDAELLNICVKHNQVDLFGQMREMIGANKSNVEKFALSVRQLHMERQLENIAHNIIKMANTPLLAGELAANKFQKAIELLTLDQTDRGGFADVKEEVKTLTDYLINRIDNGSTVAGISTGNPLLDKFTQGLRGGKVYVIAGAPGMGKTIMALQLARKALDAGKRVLMYSLEMNAQELLLRITASISSVSQTEMDSGLGENASRVSSGLHKISEDYAELLHVRGMENFGDSEEASAMQIINDFRKLDNAGLKPDLVVIDYIGLMEHSQNKGENTAYSIGRTTRKIKLLANKWNVPVLLLAQINRAASSRIDRRPMLADLRDSGSIEQDADFVAFVHRDVVYDSKSPLAGYAELLVRKNRSGPMGGIAFADNSHLYRFDNLTSQALENYAELLLPKEQKSSENTFKGYAKK